MWEVGTLVAEPKLPNSCSSEQQAQNPGDTPSVSLNLLHTAAQCIVHTIFEQLEAATEDAARNGKKDSEDDEDDEENLVLIMSQVQGPLLSKQQSCCDHEKCDLRSRSS